VAFDGDWSDPRQQRQQNEGVFSSFEVIGVARDTRSGWVWERDDTMLYLPLPPDSAVGPRTLVKLSGPKEKALPLAWSAAAARGVPVRVNVDQSVDEARNIQLLPFKGVAAIGMLLGAMALFMAVVGLYGVMAFVVSQRVREIGIRMALGATMQAVVGLFVRQGMRLVAIGIVIGGVFGTLVAVAMAKFVVGVRAFDPVALGSVALLLAGATLLACWLPARRAAKVDPMVALRTE
jgi:putative ABC transport system permease protein